MSDDGTTKDDVKVPEGEAGDKINKLFREDEKDTNVIILTAMGEEACIDAKEVSNITIPACFRLDANLTFRLQRVKRLADCVRSGPSITRSACWETKARALFTFPRVMRCSMNSVVTAKISR